MNTPHKIQPQAKVDLKLGIKSSLPNVKSTISLFILLWEATGRRDTLAYAMQNGNDIVLPDSIMDQLLEYTHDIRVSNSIDDNAFKSKVNANQLLKSQLEALIVAFELIWRLGKVTFCAKKAASAERTGNMRFPKKISYSANMDIIHYAVSNDRDKLVKTLLAWLGFSVSADTTVENALTHILCVFAEDAVFRMETAGNTDIIFNQLGIYQTGLESGEDINIAGVNEAKGPLRILKNYLKESLNPFLTSPSAGVASIAPEQKDALQPYAQRVSTLAALNAKDTVTPDIENSDVEEEENIPAADLTGLQKEAFNQIFCGAPGTGKSYDLDKKRELFFPSTDDYERVTFYPNYSFAQFVGTYKPVMKEILDENGTETNINGEKIRTEVSYEYVPGPFIRTYEKAMLAEDNKPYLLLIEELNRANAAAVFGDLFQILDRSETGKSKYPVATSEDLRKYLERRGVPTPNIISLPSNMYIWTTMNSADQGVFPLDTAFKRRWDYEYYGIAKIENDKKTYMVADKFFSWEDTRDAINEILLGKGVNEDKCLGPYYIPPEIFKSPAVAGKVFKDKVLLYLFEDAGRSCRQALFAKCNIDKAITYSKICKAFDELGGTIFGIEGRPATPTAEQGNVENA